MSEQDRLESLKDDIDLCVMSIRDRWREGYEFPVGHYGVEFIASDGISDDRHAFGVLRDEANMSNLISEIGVTHVKLNINGIEEYCNLVYDTNRDQLQVKVWPLSSGVSFKPTDEEIKWFCDEFETFSKEWEKFNESILDKEHWGQNNTALTLTDEGRERIAGYHQHLMPETVVPYLKRFYRDVYPKYMEREGIGSDYYVDGNVLSLNFDSEKPLVLEFKKDFVETKVLEVRRVGLPEDYAPDIRISYQQGNKIGMIECHSDSYECLSKFNDSKDVVEKVAGLMSRGNLYVPDLSNLSVIEEQSFILQEIYKKFLEAKQGLIHIGDDNCGDFLTDEQKSVLQPEEYAFAVCEILEQEKRDNPLIAPFIVIYDIHEDDTFVDVMRLFSTKFCQEAKDFKEMLIVADKALQEVIKPENASMNLETAIEKQGIDKDDFMEQMKKGVRSKEIIEGGSICAGAIMVETQQDRKKTAKMLSDWLQKPGKKITAAIEDMRSKAEAQGR